MWTDRKMLRNAILSALFLCLALEPDVPSIPERLGAAAASLFALSVEFLFSSSGRVGVWCQVPLIFGLLISNRVQQNKSKTQIGDPQILLEKANSSTISRFLLQIWGSSCLHCKWDAELINKIRTSQFPAVTTNNAINNCKVKDFSNYKYTENTYTQKLRWP